MPVTDEGGDIDWIFSSNSVYIAFNTYNSHPDHELGVAYFDDFDIAG
jgi:hypothetical protein